MLILLFPLTTCFSITLHANVPVSTGLNLLGKETVVDNFLTDVFKNPTSTISGWGSGTLTTERDFSWEELDFYATQNEIRDLSVQGRKIYAAGFNKTDYMQSILAFNINNPADIRLMSARNSLSGVMTAVVDGDLLYAGAIASLYSSNQIAVYNVCRPYSLTSAGVYVDYVIEDGLVTDIDPEGGFVYYASFDSVSGYSLKVLDARDPTNLVSITTNWASSKAYAIEVEGPIAYIAASYEGFYVLDVSEKRNPIQLDHFILPGNATDVLIDGNFAYVTSKGTGVSVFDISNPSNIDFIGLYNTQGLETRLAIQGKTLFVVDTNNGIAVLDIADPYNPTFVTQIPISGITYDVELYGGILVVGTNMGIHTFRISSGWGITDFTNGVYPNSFNNLHSIDVKVQGNTAFVAGGYDGFYTLDVSNPANPVLLDHYEYVGYYISNLDVKGNFAYCVFSEGLLILDVTDPSNIQLASLELGTDLTDIFMAGEIGYISFGAPGVAGIALINFTNPYSPVFITNNFFGTDITSVYIEGYRVYGVNNLDGNIGPGLHTFDIVHNPYTFTYNDIDTRICYFRNVYADGDIVYTSDKDWLVVFNVADPYNIDPYDDIDVIFNHNYVDSNGVCTFGPYILNAGGKDGIYLINHTDVFPAAGYFPSTYYNETSINALQITTYGDYTYVACNETLKILRHFESAGDTYIAGSNIAESLDMRVTENKLVNATLHFSGFIPDGTSITFYLSADGGNTWEQVQPGIFHEFNKQGKNLRWKAVFTSLRDRSPHLYWVEISYGFSAGLSPTLLYIIIGGAGFLALVIIIIIIVASVRKKKTPTR